MVKNVSTQKFNWKRNLIGAGIFGLGMVMGTLTTFPTQSNLEKERDYYQNLSSQKDQEMIDWAAEQAESGYKLIYLKDYCTVMDNYLSMFKATEDLITSQSPYLLNTTSWKESVEAYGSWKKEYKDQECEGVN